MVDDMPEDVDKSGTGRTTYARVLLSLAISACVALLAFDCSRSHVQETVTVAPRAAATPAPAITPSNSSSAPPTVDAEAEAGDTKIAHCAEAEVRVIWAETVFHVPPVLT